MTRGLPASDIYRLDVDGKAIEHWDTLQIVGDPKNSAPLIAPEHSARQRQPEWF